MKKTTIVLVIVFLGLGGYFTYESKLHSKVFGRLISKDLALVQKYTLSFMEDIRFKDWSVIGAELLVKGSYTCVGGSVEVEIRLFDVFWGRQILGKRALGDTKHYRYLMHRLSNEIIKKLTGYGGISLSKLAFS